MVGLRVPGPSTERRQHARHESQQFVERLEMGSLPGRHVLDPARPLTALYIRSFAELYDKGSLR
jgi:hypothetical protein